MLQRRLTPIPPDSPQIMSDDAPVRHPAEFKRMCDDAIERFRALADAEPGERGRMIPGIREALGRIDAWIDEQDIGATQAFAREQALLVNASSALQSIDLDRGGPHVRRYAERAIADIQQVAG